MKQETSQQVKVLSRNFTGESGSQKPIKSDFFEGLQLQCPYFQKAYEYCCEQRCKQNAVICIKEDCKCKIPHKNCDYFSKIRTFNQKINDKIINYSPDYQLEIEKNTNHIIDRVSQMLGKINQNLNTFGLNKNEQNVKDSVREHFNKINLIENDKKLTGQNLFKFRSEQKQADKGWFQYSSNKYLNIIKQTKKVIEPFFQQIEGTLIYMHSIYAQEQSLKNYLSNSAILKSSSGTLFSDLQKFIEIFSQNLEIDGMRKVFSFTKQMKMFSVENMFGSQPQKKQLGRFGNQKNEVQIFQSKQQKEKQDEQDKLKFKQLVKVITGKTNLIFLIKNTNGIRYGAYTPCQIAQNAEWKQDTSNSGFIFKVDSNHSEKLCTPQKSLKVNSANLEVGNIKNQPLSNVQNGFMLGQKNGQFISQILFLSNPTPTKVSPNTGLFNNITNDKILHIAESSVSILEVYEVKISQSFKQKLQVNKQSANSIFCQKPKQKN